MAIQLTPEDIQTLQTFKDNKDYPGAYEFLRIRVIASGENGDPNTATWLGMAVRINADDGSAVSEFVRGVTLAASEFYGSNAYMGSDSIYF